MTTNEVSLVEVIWHDAYTHPNHSWIDLDEITETIDDDPYVVRSVGFLIAEAKQNYVVLAQSVSDEQADSLLCIPVGMVHSVRVIS